MHIQQLRFFQALSQRRMLPTQLMANVLGLVLAVLFEQQALIGEHATGFHLQRQQMALRGHHGQIKFAKPLNALVNAGPRQAVKHIKPVRQPHAQHFQQLQLPQVAPLLGRGSVQVGVDDSHAWVLQKYS